MFYLTQSIEKGPPERGCLAPFVDEISDLMGNLGSAMVASAVFFLLMIFFVWPMCCFKRADAADGVKPFDNEGGEIIEMQDQNIQSSEVNDGQQANATNVTRICDTTDRKSVV